MADENIRELVVRMSFATALMQSQVREAERVIDNFDNKASTASRNVEQNFQRVGASAGQMRAGFQQLSFQIGDVATQFASGTRPMQIFAQQSSQVIQALGLMTGNAKGLLGFLGSPWGQIITAATVVLAPFIARLFDSGEAASTAEAKIRSYASAADLGQRQIEAFQKLQQLNSARSELSSLEGFSVEGVGRRLFDPSYTLQIASARNAINQLSDEYKQAQGLVDLYGKRLRESEVAEDTLQKARLRVATATDAVARAQANLNLVEQQATADLNAHRITEEQYVARVRAAELAVKAAQSAKQSDTRAVREATKAYDDLNRTIASIASRVADVDLGSLLKQTQHNVLDDIGVDGLEGMRKKIDEIEDRRNAAVDERTRKVLEGIDREREEVRTLARLFEDGFKGGTRAIWGDFKDLGMQVIAQVLARFVASSFGGSGGGFNLGSAFSTAIGSIFGGSFASGGNPPVGKASLVGERGPELFVPKVPGTIIPNGGIGGGTSLNMTINAPGATGETVAMIRRELAAAAPMLIGAANQATMRNMSRRRLG